MSFSPLVQKLSNFSPRRASCFADKKSRHRGAENEAIFRRAAGEKAEAIARVEAVARAGNGLVVDLSRHFNAIVEIDRGARRVRVQPGVVRNELNLELAKQGLFFGPETSMANRAMIGGMVGNNSCGSSSIVYGSTREHLVSVRGFFSDGTEGILHALGVGEFQAKCADAPGVEGRVYRRVRDLLGEESNRRLITDNFPRASIPRRNTGYALDLLMDASALDPASGRDFNFCRLIAGSEGTLFFGLEFELDCDSLPPHAALVCGHFRSVNEALRANLIAVEHAPSAGELIDRHILECTKSNLAQQRNRDFVVGDPGAILVAELRRDDAHFLAEVIASLQTRWKAVGYGYAVPVLRGEESAKVWELRRAGQGLMSNVVGDAKPREVVEDTAVDVRDLPDYIAEFNALLLENTVSVVSTMRMQGPGSCIRGRFSTSRPRRGSRPSAASRPTSRIWSKNTGGPCAREPRVCNWLNLDCSLGPDAAGLMFRR